MGITGSCVYFEGIPDGRSAPRPVKSEARVTSAGDHAPSPAVVVEFFRELFGQAGLDCGAYRQKALHRRLPACLRFLRVPDAGAAVEKLRRAPQWVPETLGIALLGVTEFCRDREVFAAMESLVVPQLVRCDQPLRVWSAACSDGRELYSAAALLERAGLADGCEFLGTDCREEALERARRGLFSAESADKLDGWWSGRFLREGDGVRAPDALRARVRWKCADLLVEAEPGPWDLILWRNMAIYLEPPAVARVWANLLAELAPGGFIVSGKADHPPRHAGLERVSACIFRKP